MKRLIGKSIADMENSGRLDEVEVKELSGKEILLRKDPIGIKDSGRDFWRNTQTHEITAEKNCKSRLKEL